MENFCSLDGPLYWWVNVAREQPCFLARARYENCSPGLKLSSSAGASSSGFLALSCRGCKVTSKVGGGGSRTDPAHEVHGHGTVPAPKRASLQTADICPRNVCYKRVGHTSESATPPTLITTPTSYHYGSTTTSSSILY